MNFLRNLVLNQDNNSTLNSNINSNNNLKTFPIFSKPNQYKNINSSKVN